MTTPSTEADLGRRLTAIEEAVRNLQRERRPIGSTLDNCPTGMVAAFLSETPPQGWLLLDGTVVTSSGYPALYAYLTANGISTTLPDVRDSFLVGAGNLYAGLATGGTKDAAVVAHTHATGLHSTASESAGFGLTASASFADRVRVDGVGDNTGSTGATGTDANLPPYFAAYWMIRT